MALRFAELGAAIAVSGRRLEPLDAVVAEIAAKGGRAAAAPCDVRDPAQVDTALARIRETLGVPDILVNNAAGNFLCSSEELTPNGFAAVVAIVLHGTFHCTRAAADVDRGEPGGTILSIATTYAETGSGFVLPARAPRPASSR
jgi:NAD(P)-dependent dehydrogenase (short-subunit alcohol dehydrogenase family)